MTTSINEAVRFSNNARAEIKRIALKSDKTSTEVEREIIDFMDQQSASHSLAALTVSKSDIVAYEISRSALKIGVFYYDIESDSFVQVHADTAGSPSGVEGEHEFEAETDEQEEDKEVKQAEEDKEADDEAAEDDPEEDALAADVGHAEASALRQKHGAIVAKTVTFSDGRTSLVRMSPLARYYHLLPRSAIIEHVNEIWKTQASPILRRALSQGKRGNSLSQSITASITALFDQLRVETCLSDVELNVLQKAILESADRTTTDMTAPQIKQRVDDVMQKSISLALQSRSEKSNIFDYIARDNSKVATPDEYVQIDSGVGDRITVTSSNIARLSSALESMMSTRNVRIAPNTRAAKMYRGLRRRSGLPGERGGLYSDMPRGTYADLGSAITGMDEYAPDHMGKRGAASGDDVQDSMADFIDAKRAKNSFETIPTLNVKKMNDDGDYAPYEPVKIKIRSGDTAETVHNHIHDLSDLGEESESSTPGYVLFDEIKHVAESIASNAMSLQGRAGDEQFVLFCREKIRDQLAILSGLIEYFAMSGLDVKPDELSASKLGGTRSQILDLAKRSNNSALDITDAIVAAESLRDNRRNRVFIEAKIKTLKKRLDNMSNVATDDDKIEKEKTGFTREMAALELEKKGTTQIYADLADKIESALNKARLTEAVRNCQAYVPATKRDEEEHDSAESRKKPSRFNILLARTRAKRMRQVEISQKREINTLIPTFDGSAAVAALNTSRAVERLERQVDETMRKLVSHNEIQFHALQPLDTIDSVCRQHRIGLNPLAEEIRTGFSFTGALPRRYDKRGLSVERYYTVDGEDTKSGSRRDPVMKVSYHDVGAEKTGEIKVPRSQIRTAASVTDEAVSAAAARNKFATELRYSAAAALRDVSLQIDRAGDTTVMPRLNPSEPLIPQLAKFLYESDMQACDRLYTGGIEGVKKSMIDARIDRDLAPDPRADARINEKLVFAITIVAEASRRAGRGAQFADAVRVAFGSEESDTASARFVNRIRLVTGGTAQGDRDVADASQVVDGLIEIGKASGKNTVQSLQPLVNSVSESLSMVTRGRQRRVKIAEALEERKYEQNLVGHEIPVPKRALLVPGSTVVVSPAKRSIGRTGREHMHILGINPTMMLSDPLTGFVAAIEYAGFARGLMPTLSYISEALSEKFASRLLEVMSPTTTTKSGKVVRRTLTPGETAIVNRIAADSLRDIFMSPVAPGVEDIQSAERKAVLRTYRRINSIVESGGIGVLSEEGIVASSATSDQVAQSIRDLRNAFLDAAARAITSDEGAKQLYRAAPCTAVMLNRIAFTQREMMLFNILTPSPDDALKTMTADFYREAMTGIQSSKAGRDPFFSREVDRIAISMRVLNDFYTDLVAAAERIADEGKAVVSRLVRKFSAEAGINIVLYGKDGEEISDVAGVSKSDSEKRAEILRKVAGALGLPDNASLAQMENAGDEAAQEIIAEMSSLSDTSRNNKIIKEVTRIVEETLGFDKRRIFVNANAERQVQDCTNVIANWLNAMRPITTREAQELSREDPHQAVNFGVPQMIERISNDAFTAVYNSYVEESRTAVQPYTIRRKQ